MQDFFDENIRELEAKALVLIVVGAHLEAETTDRALAYRLREHVLAWQDVIACPEPVCPVVCSDLWYLNNQPLRLRPTITLGRPETNAATAYLAARVPTAFVLEDVYRIQFDPELIDLNACIWGSRPQATADAMECFIDRYLDEFLRGVHQMPSGTT